MCISFAGYNKTGRYFAEPSPKAEPSDQHIDSKMIYMYREDGMRERGSGVRECLHSVTVELWSVS